MLLPNSLALVTWLHLQALTQALPLLSADTPAASNPSTPVLAVRNAAPEEFAVCNSMQYSPNTYWCSDNEMLVPVGMMPCGNAAYDPAYYTCLHGTIIERALQPLPRRSLEMDYLCGTTLYPSEDFTCFNKAPGHQILAPAGFNLCGDAAFNPETYMCIGKPDGTFQLAKIDS